MILLLCFLGGSLYFYKLVFLVFSTIPASQLCLSNKSNVRMCFFFSVCKRPSSIRSSIVYVSVPFHINFVVEGSCSHSLLVEYESEFQVEKISGFLMKHMNVYFCVEVGRETSLKNSKIEGIYNGSHLKIGFLTLS